MRPRGTAPRARKTWDRRSAQAGDGARPMRRRHAGASESAGRPRAPDQLPVPSAGAERIERASRLQAARTGPEFRGMAPSSAVQRCARDRLESDRADRQTPYPRLRRRAALAELNRARDDPAPIADILRRTALAAYPRMEVASLSSGPWVTFLDARAKEGGFAGGAGRAIAEAPYRPVPPASGLPALARRWIRTDKTAGNA